MALRLEALMWAVGVGFFVWKFVVPMIAKIPSSLEIDWRAEYMEYAESHVEGEELGKLCITTSATPTAKTLSVDETNEPLHHRF